MLPGIGLDDADSGRGGTREQLLPGGYGGTQVIYIGGIVSSENLYQFKKNMFRTTRGKVNIWTKELALAAGDTLRSDNYHTQSHSFICAFQEGQAIEARMMKICKSFAEDPDSIMKMDLGGRGEAVAALEKEKKQLKEAIRVSSREVRGWLAKSDGEWMGKEPDRSVYKVLKLFVLRERQINAHLNMLRQGEGLISQGLIWCPTCVGFGAKISELFGSGTLDKQFLAYEKASDAIPLAKPTYFRLNAFTKIF